MFVAIFQKNNIMVGKQYFNLSNIYSQTTSWKFEDTKFLHVFALEHLL